MKRDQALEIIRTEVAKHGKINGTAMMIYIENRISKQAYDKAVNDGF